MACIKELDFAILVNGCPTRWFKSATGLRQEDPLLPYLFILGAEVFVRLVKMEQVNGGVSSIRIGNGCGSMSQLSYVDDCILFIKVVSTEA